MIRMRRSSKEWCMSYGDFKSMDFRKVCAYLKLNPDQ